MPHMFFRNSEENDDEWM